MASGRHECSICMDTFKNPKLLSCHHSFCYKCLDDYTRVNLHNGRFDCPICRASVELPKSGVSGFQSNFYIEETDTSDTYYCDLCGPKNVACSRCLDCEENLCQSCCHAHEKSKGTRHHKICDMGTLDSKTKGQIRQRIFCDQHSADEIRLFCRDCKVLICVICKVVNHEIHDTKLVDDVAAEMKKTLQTKLNECTEKLRRIDASKQRGDELDIRINDAEIEELKSLQDQHSHLNKMLDQKVANVKARIQNVYKELRQQNAIFIRDMQNDFKTCSNAKDNAQNLVDHGTVIDIIKKCPDLEQLVSAVISKTDKTPNTRLERKLFSPVEIKPDELISLVGILLDSTEISPDERKKPLKKEKEKLEREEKQKKEWSQGTEAKVKALNEELFKTRKQYEEANAKVITKGTKLAQAEIEIQALRNQIAGYVPQVEREKKEREKKEKKEREDWQIKAYRSWAKNQNWNWNWPPNWPPDETIKENMCSKCQGWKLVLSHYPGLKCQCASNQ